MAHVLVIDDDRTVLALVSGILEAHGHSVSTAQDGLEGMKVLVKGHIDLVVTDIVMPGQEGMATIGAIRRTHATIPILAMSGSHTAGRYGSYLDAATLLGANATLAKPITVPVMPRSGLCRMASARGRFAGHRPCGCSA